MSTPRALSSIRLTLGVSAAVSAAILALIALASMWLGAWVGQSAAGAGMNANAAAAIVAAALAVLALQSGSRSIRALGYCLTAATAFVAAATLAQHLFGFDFEIDQALGAEATGVSGHPGRMNLATCAALVFASIALSLGRTNSPLLEDLRQFARLAGLAIPLFVLALHLYDSSALKVIRGFETTPLLTAVALTLLMLAIGLDRPVASLRWQIAYVGVIIVGPLAALTVHFASSEREIALANAGARLAATARLGADGQDAVIVQGRQMLEFLERSPVVRAGNPNCGRELAEYIPLNPAVRAIFTVGRDGVIDCSGDPASAGMSIADREYVRDGFQTGQFTVSGYFLARSNGKPRIAMATPIRNGGDVEGLIVASLDLEALGDPLERLASEGPAGATVTLIDKSGVVIARYPREPALVGSSLADATFVTEALANPDRTYQAAETNGAATIFAARRVLSGEGTLIVGLPQSEVVGSVDARLNRRLALVCAILAGSLILGVIGGEALMFRPLRRLISYAGRLEIGDLAARPDVRAGGEVGALGRALAVTAAAIEDRERRLAEAEALFRGLFDHSPDSKAVVRVEPDGQFRIETWNAAAAQTSGLTASEVIGRTPREVFPGARGETIEHDLDRTVSSGRVMTIEREPIVQGQSTVFEMVQVPLRGPDGRVERIFLSARDISERKRVERLKNEFVSTVSHELRTPLTSIAGSLGLLAGGAAGPLGEKARHLIGIAHSNSLRLVRLINDILDIEKIEAGRMAFELRAIVVSDIVEQAIAGLRAYADEFDVSVEVEQSGELLMVRGDADRLTQVVTNLLSNAIKFSPRGEAVTVSMRADGEIVTIAICDRGSGIPEAFRSRIFTKFAQADGSDSRRKGGTGLGLAIVKEIVDRHAGAVGYRTELGKGTVFEVRFPRHAVRDRLPALGEAFAEPPARHTVLICEDDPLIAQIFAEQMGDAGFSSVTAGSVRAAMHAISAQKIDAVLVDLNLPDGDGFALVRDLRASLNGRDVPVLVVSADAERRRTDPRAGPLDIAAWFEKPVDINKLSQAVKRRLTPRDERPRVLHVEDDADLRKVVSAALTPLAQVVSVEGVSDAKAELERGRFALAILDAKLEDGSGLELLSLLETTTPAPTPAILFSAIDVDRSVSARVVASLTKSRTSLAALVDVVRRNVIGRDTAEDAPNQTPKVVPMRSRV